MHEKIVLPNGARIVFEKMPHVRSAAVGLWVGVGSRNEKAAENGSAHFIEHMLFKGTEQYTAAQLAGIMDGIGGQINAFTTRESTCFYARTLDSHLDTAIQLLGDMFFRSRFAQEDVENERGVILEEIDMYNDTPDDLVLERLFHRSFKGALGRPVLGKPSTLAKMSGESLREFMRKNYVADRVVVSLCGSFEDRHVQSLADRFSAMEKEPRGRVQASAYTPVMTTKKKATEQNHLCLAFPGLQSGAPRRFILQLMSSILGGGMSSRLFQSVRETHGLCYSIFSFNAGFRDTGLFGIETALGGDTEEKALGLIMDELKKLQDEGVTQDELYRAREQIKSNLVMTLESTSARMNKIGSGELILGRSMTTDELIEEYDRVTREDILEAARQLIDLDNISFSAVGRVGPPEEYRRVLGLNAG